MIDPEEGVGADLQEREGLLLEAERKDPGLAAKSLETLSPKVTWKIENAPMDLGGLAETSRQGTEGTASLLLTTHRIMHEGRNVLKKSLLL